MTPRGGIRLKQYVKAVTFRYGLFLHSFGRTIYIAGLCINILAILSAIACVVALLLLAGYDHRPSDRHMLHIVINAAQTVFIIQVLFNLIFKFKSQLKTSKILKCITDVTVLSTLVSVMSVPGANTMFPFLDRVLHSSLYVDLVLLAYSVIEISRAVMSITSRRTNPSLLLASSFLFFILIGSFVLMLPKCTVGQIGYIDSLFLATSTVCITGLTPVDVSQTFTPIGLTVMAVLIQIGGIGVLTFTSFFALFFSGSASVYNQLMIRDMVYSKSMNDLIPTLVYTIIFTLSIEAIGAVCIYFAVPPSLGMTEYERMLFAAFHSLSSFCNAGFSSLPEGMANPALMTSGQMFYNITSILILAGAIGFPILVNFKEILFGRAKSLWARLNGRHADVPLHLSDLNTKLVLVTTLSILVVGSASFFALEYYNTLNGLSLWQKISQSVFNSLIPRSAGFQSLDPNHFLPITLIIIMVQMWIGGASQSLGGGVKVNTVAAIWLSLRATVTGSSHSWAYDRSISEASVRRAFAVLVLSFVSFLVFLGIIIYFEPKLPFKEISFEVTSALFTVGSSLGITPYLSDASKLTLCVAMLLGRVGILSLLTGFFVHHRDTSDLLPQDNIIIN